MAQEAAQSTGSMGVATEICRIPGEKPPRGCATDSRKTRNAYSKSACFLVPSKSLAAFPDKCFCLFARLLRGMHLEMTLAFDHISQFRAADRSAALH